MDAVADKAGLGRSLYRSRFPESARRLRGSWLKGLHYRPDGPDTISIHATGLVVAWCRRIFRTPRRHIDLARSTHTSRRFSYSLRYADRNYRYPLAIGLLRQQRWVRVSPGIVRYVSCTLNLGRRHGLNRSRVLERTTKIRLKTVNRES